MLSINYLAKHECVLRIFPVIHLPPSMLIVCHMWKRKSIRCGGPHPKLQLFLAAGNSCVRSTGILSLNLKNASERVSPDTGSSASASLSHSSVSEPAVQPGPAKAALTVCTLGLKIVFID